MNTVIKVLLIDDEEPIRRNLRSFLEDSGYQVADASNGREGLAAFIREQPDVVLTDLRMAEGSGMEFIAAMKARTPDTPVIIVSGTGQVQDAIEAIRQGAWDYLVKPIEGPGVLQHTINMALERKALLRQVREYQRGLEERAAQLRMLASRLMTAEHRERRRVAQILQEHFQQLLAAAKLAIGMLRARLVDASLCGLLKQAEEAINESIRISRSLTLELCPPILYDLGLAAALDSLGRWMQDKYRLKVDVQADPQADPPDEDVGVMLFHSVRELLVNVVKHAQVDRATVSMSLVDATHVQMLVADQGAGFDVAQHLPSSEGAGAFGLFSIRERIETAGGRLVVDSHPGRGTRVTMVVPIGAAREEAVS
jgi:signal transduction histidine kinase